MSTTELLARSLRNSATLQSLQSYRNHLEEHTMTSPIMTSHANGAFEEDNWSQGSLGTDSGSYDDTGSTKQRKPTQGAIDTVTPLSRDRNSNPESETAGYYITPVDTLDLRQRPQNYSIVFLRERLRERGLPISGSKNVLIERLILNH